MELKFLLVSVTGPQEIAKFSEYLKNLPMERDMIQKAGSYLGTCSMEGKDLRARGGILSLRYFKGEDQ